MLHAMMGYMGQTNCRFGSGTVDIFVPLPDLLYIIFENVGNFD